MEVSPIIHFCNLKYTFIDVENVWDFKVHYVTDKSDRAWEINHEYLILENSTF